MGAALPCSALAPSPTLDDRDAIEPRTLGKYELLRALARGGMGEVYLARLPGELGFEKRLVIKTIRAELADDPRFVELFAAEARIAVELGHPNIAPIYELGRADDGTLYTAMGWVDGPSLAMLGDRLRAAGRPLEPGAALFIVRELLEGLAHAHSPDRDRPPIVHRDITPRNVLVDRSGRVQIVDFGIARPAAAESRGAAGSAGYMAPEQARGGAVDPRADVFSVGCVLYELLTNQRAFGRDGVWMNPPLDDVPTKLHGLLGHALALDPADRYADADAFRRELAPILAEVAPSFGSRDLAEILRGLFEDGSWDSGDATPHGDEQTPATALTGVETFATRLRPTTEPDLITGAVPVLPAIVGEIVDERPSPDERPLPIPQPELVAPTPVATSRGPSHVTVAIIALAAAVVAGLLGTRFGPREASEPTSTIETQPPERAPEPSPTPPPPEPETPTPTPTRTLELRVSPADAELRLDDRPLDGPPHVIELGPDDPPRELVVSHPRHHSQRVRIDADAPPSNPLTIELAPLETGTLGVVAPSVAWAEVWLDGTKIGTTPLADKAVLEGRHKLEVRCTAEVCDQARTLLERSVQIKPGRDNKFTAP